MRGRDLLRRHPLEELAINGDAVVKRGRVGRFQEAVDADHSQRPLDDTAAAAPARGRPVDRVAGSSPRSLRRSGLMTKWQKDASGALVKKVGFLNECDPESRSDFSDSAASGIGSCVSAAVPSARRSSGGSQPLPARRLAAASAIAVDGELARAAAPAGHSVSQLAAGAPPGHEQFPAPRLRRGRRPVRRTYRAGASAGPASRAGRGEIGLQVRRLRHRRLRRGRRVASGGRHPRPDHRAWKRWFVSATRSRRHATLSI